LFLIHKWKAKSGQLVHQVGQSVPWLHKYFDIQAVVAQISLELLP